MVPADIFKTSVVVASIQIAPPWSGSRVYQICEFLADVQFFLRTHKRDIQPQEPCSSIIHTLMLSGFFKIPVCKVLTAVVGALFLVLRRSSLPF